MALDETEPRQSLSATTESVNVNATPDSSDIPQVIFCVEDFLRSRTFCLGFEDAPSACVPFSPFLTGLGSLLRVWGSVFDLEDLLHD